MMYSKIIPLVVSQRFYSKALVETMPVVTLPAYIKHHVARQQRKEKLKLLHVPKVKAIGGNKAFPLITSQKADFDFYLGQRYPKNYRVPLVSEHWMKKNTSGQKFTIHKHGKNPSLPVSFNRVGIDEKFDFSQFGLAGDIVEALQNQGIIYPTPPQAEAIPEILRKRNVMLVAECGSGKTMAYIVPILQSILQLREKVGRQPDSPLAIVVVPGKELAEQIAFQAYNVCAPSGIDVRVLVSGGTMHKHLVPRNKSNVDILVGTFGILEKLFKKKIFSIRNLHHVVLDEADTLLDDSFSAELQQFLQYVLAYNDESMANLLYPKVQLILASCTWAPDFEQALCELIPIDEIKRVVSPHAHRIMPHITHKFMRVRDSVRAGVLLEKVKVNADNKIPVMVFSNQSPACDWMSTFFYDNDIPNAKLHAGMSIEERTAAFNDFKDGIVHVLCCTDLASRGLDLQWVRHVINFDFPHNMSDYVHRSGRIGRVGSNHGHITNLVNSIPGASVVQQIELAIRNSTGLPSIDANIKRKIEKLKYISQYERKFD